ncbi:hypothetical protein BJ741DRAFT_703309 [Chytriomyces cf. hyalinus JEL632]|nr:hypothetical protein BJ741DRAFT_703309 [Chytriomyces cf. hyalinus JEL632]
MKNLPALTTLLACLASLILADVITQSCNKDMLAFNKGPNNKWAFKSSDQPGAELKLWINNTKLFPKSDCGVYVYLYYDDEANYQYDKSGNWQPEDPESTANRGVVCDSIAHFWNQTNFNTPKSIYCYGLGLAGVLQVDVPIPYIAIFPDAKDESSAWCEGVIPASYTIDSYSTTSYVCGDPHFWTPDGNYMDYQDLGWFWFFRSQYYGVYIQARQYSCNHYVTCIDSLVVQYEQTLVVIAPWDAVKSSGRPAVSMPIGQGLGQVDVFVTSAKHDHGWNVQLQFDTGFVINVASYRWFCTGAHCSWYLCITQQVPGKYVKPRGGNATSGGMVGQMDGIKANDFIHDPTEMKSWYKYAPPTLNLPSSTVNGYALSGYAIEFGQRNRVGDGDVLLDRCVDSLGNGIPGGLFPTRRCSATQKMPIRSYRPAPYASPRGYMMHTTNITTKGPIVKTMPPADSTLFYLPANVNPKERSTLRKYARDDEVDLEQPGFNVTDGFKHDAHEACDLAIDGDSCPFLNETLAIQACVNDCIMSGSFDLIDAHKVAFQQKCTHTVINIQAHVEELADKGDDHEVGRRDGKKGKKPAWKKKYPKRKPEDDNAVVKYRNNTVKYTLADMVRQANKVSRNLGLGDHKCDCVKGQGDCSQGGCMCKKGFTGKRCEKDLTKYGKKHPKKQTKKETKKEKDQKEKDKKEKDKKEKDKKEKDKKEKEKKEKEEKEKKEKENKKAERDADEEESQRIIRRRRSVDHEDL